MALPTASDNEFPKVILEEVANDGSATVTPAADHRALFVGEDGALHLKDSSGTVTDIGSGAADLGTWSTYTPTWTATSVNPAIGNGTISGRYIISGKVMLLKIRVLWGSTTTNGTGNYRWTYPSGTVSQRWILHASHFDSSAGQYRFGQAWTNFVDSTHIAVVSGGGTNTEWGASQPVANAQSDILDITGMLELD